MTEIKYYTSINIFTDVFFKNYDTIVPNKEYEEPSAVNIEILSRMNDAKCKVAFLASAVKIGTTYFTSFTAQGITHVLKNPETHLNEFGVLHSIDGPAVSWDDYKLHIIHGVIFEDVDLWKKISDKKLSIMDMFKLENIEQRRVALTHYGSERMFKELKPELIHSSKRGNKLWHTEIQVPGHNGRETTFPISFLQYDDPYTKREYISFVDPDIKEADDAMTSKFPDPTHQGYDLTREEYDQLEVEA